MLVRLPAGQAGELEVRFNTLQREVDALRQDPGLDEVYISGYPTAPFSSQDEGGNLEFRSCGIFSGTAWEISPDDGALLESRGQQLNDLIRRKADEFGWHYVDVADEFQGHGYCSPDDSTFWVRASESCRRQGDFRGTMHPNYRGQAVYALALATALREHTFTPPRRPGPGGQWPWFQAQSLVRNPNRGRRHRRFDRGAAAASPPSGLNSERARAFVKFVGPSPSCSQHGRKNARCLLCTLSIGSPSAFGAVKRLLERTWRPSVRTASGWPRPGVRNVG